MNLIPWLAAALVLTRGLAELWLGGLNRCHVLAHEQAVQEPFKENIDLATYAKSIQYMLAKGRFGQKEQQGDPAALGIHRCVIQLLAERSEAAPILVRFEEMLEAAALSGGTDQDDADRFEQSVVGGGGPTIRRCQLLHAAKAGSLTAIVPQVQF